MRLLFLLLSLSFSLLAYEKGKIDMHGGKADQLTKGGFSNNFSLNDSLKDSKETKASKKEPNPLVKPTTVKPQSK